MRHIHWKIVLAAAVLLVGAPLLPRQAAAKDSTNSSTVTSAARGRTVSAQRALYTPVTELNVDGATLEKVIDYLRVTSGANIVVNWKVLEGANVTKDTPITLSISNVPLRKALQLVLDQASPEQRLVFPIDSNVMTITTETEADKVVITRVYVVDDLVMTDNQVSNPPSINLSTVSSSGTSSGGSSSSGSGSLFTDNSSSNSSANQQTSQQRGDDLVKLITEVVRPTIWRDNGGSASIKYFSGKLIVTAPASVQEAIGGPMLPEGGQALGVK